MISFQSKLLKKRQISPLTYEKAKAIFTNLLLYSSAVCGSNAEIYTTRITTIADKHQDNTATTALQMGPFSARKEKSSTAKLYGRKGSKFEIVQLQNLYFQWILVSEMFSSASPTSEVPVLLNSTTVWARSATLIAVLTTTLFPWFKTGIHTYCMCTHKDTTIMRGRGRDVLQGAPRGLWISRRNVND